ncbi:hypothetical protein F4680DRAFT_418150 [Xylaria scruposa]|nr:hypothetical protein F4680DRAFT_418150 [Xylaria scruposa]
MGEQPRVDSPKAGSSKNGTASSAWTPEMLDRQARGKNPYNADSDDSDWGPGQRGNGSSSAATNVGPQRVGVPKPKDRFAIYERRRIASQILNSTELLMMAAVRDDESIPATRLKYMRVLCGLEGSGDGTARAGAAAAHPSTGDNQRKRINLDQGCRSVSGNTREQ